MKTINPYVFSHGGNDGSDYDGTTGYFERTSDLVGNADSKKMMYSTWFISDEDDRIQRLVNGNTAVSHIGYDVFKFSDNKFFVQARNSSGTSIVSVATSNVFLSDALWHHLLIGFDTTTGVVENYIYMDGASQSLGVFTFTTDGIVDFTRDIHSIGRISQGGGGGYWNGCLYNTWFGPDEFLPGAEAVAAFYGNGAPPFLGSDGSVPTGNQPLSYSPSAEFASDQQGSGGVYVKSGTVGACATVPA